MFEAAAKTTETTGQASRRTHARTRNHAVYGILGVLVLLVGMCPAMSGAQNAGLKAVPGGGDVPVFVDHYADDEFCASGRASQTVPGPCAVAPVDVSEFDANFVYRFLAYHAQRPFDRFSWQAMTALMAPTNDPLQPARWEAFPTRRDLFAAGALPNEACHDALPDGHLLLASHVQSSGDILVDQAGNFILYETRINPVAERYILENDLHMPAGRAAMARAGKPVAFPMGAIKELNRDVIDGGMPNADVGANGTRMTAAGVAKPPVPHGAPGMMGAQLLKFAWRILPGGDGAAIPDADSYYTRPARISLAAGDTLDGRAKCLDVRVGLVGLHLVQRVQSGNGDRWIWSSFEHVGNVPLAANARRPNSIITDDPFPDGCLAPAPSGHSHLFYGGRTQQGQTANRASVRSLRWADRPPYARTDSGGMVVPPDIVRCWRLFSGTAETNFIWQNRLAGTVWQNYMLLGTQWIGNPGGATFGIGEVPRFLSNSALESFIQHQPDASCLGCHATATTDAGQKANFTFLLDPGS